MKKQISVESKKLQSLKSKYLPEEKRTTYIVVAVFVWASWATLGAIRNNYELQRKVDEINEKIAQIEIDNDRLEFSNEFYDTEEYLDIAARLNLNKIAPGERVLVVPERDDQFDKSGNLKNTTIQSEKSNFAEWLDFLFSIDL